MYTVEISIDSLENAIRALDHHRSQLSVWNNTKPPLDLNEFEKAASNILTIEQFLTEFNNKYSGLVLVI